MPYFNVSNCFCVDCFAYAFLNEKAIFKKRAGWRSFFFTDVEKNGVKKLLKTYMMTKIVQSFTICLLLLTPQLDCLSDPLSLPSMPDSFLVL